MAFIRQYVNFTRLNKGQLAPWLLPYSFISFLFLNVQTKMPQFGLWGILAMFAAGLAFSLFSLVLSSQIASAFYKANPLELRVAFPRKQHFALLFLLIAVNILSRLLDGVMSATIHPLGLLLALIFYFWMLLLGMVAYGLGLLGREDLLSNAFRLLNGGFWLTLKETLIFIILWLLIFAPFVLAGIVASIVLPSLGMLGTFAFMSLGVAFAFPLAATFFAYLITSLEEKMELSDE